MTKNICLEKINIIILVIVLIEMLISQEIKYVMMFNIEIKTMTSQQILNNQSVQDKIKMLI